MATPPMFSDDELHEHESIKAQRAPAVRPLTSAAAATDESRAVAQVQAAMLIAQRFPRDEVAALDRILMAFTRPALAEASLFDYSRGGSEIAGLTIRAAEAIAQRWGHIHMGVEELDQRDGVSTVRAFAFDAQSGTQDSRVFHVRHWRDTKKGGYQIEDARDVYELVANMAARRKRACILTVIPVDVQDAVKQQIAVTMKANAELSMTAENIATLVQTFEKFGVTRAQLETRIQRRMDAITPAAYVALRKISNSLRDGMSVAADWFGEPEAEGGGETKAAPTRGMAGLRERAEKATERRPAAKAAEPTPAAPAITYADMMARIAKAKTRDDFDLLQDLLPAIANEQHRAECDVELRAARAKVPE